MIKRDTIQRLAATITEDDVGGQNLQLQWAENIPAHISIGASLKQLTEFGNPNELILNVVTNTKLDEYLYTRYQYSGKLFKLIRQIKQGNEYYSTLEEVSADAIN